MNILFDTSVLVAAMIESHPLHELSLPYLQKVKNSTHTGLISAHSIAELYSILTSLPVQPRISPVLARKLIEMNILNLFEIIPLSVQDYISVIEHLSDSGTSGGVIYDALILKAALTSNADKILTLNKKDFYRIYPDLADKIISPSDRVL
jgi:predicted nucleic acid-binding protein